MGRVGIIGAGVSGLCAAHALVGRGMQVRIWDPAPEAGGAVRSVRDGGWLAECGPNTLLVNDKGIADLIAGLGLGDAVLDANPLAKRRYIVHEGRPVALPSGPVGFACSPLLSARAKLRLLAEPFLPRGSRMDVESFADFVRRRLGPEPLRMMACPFVAGIYAGDPELLSYRLAFPRMYRLEREHRSLVLGGIRKLRERRRMGMPAASRMISFPEGLGTLVRRLAEGLPAGSLGLGATLVGIARASDGWEISWREGTGPVRVEIVDSLICAVPAHALSRLPWPDDIGRQLLPATQVFHPAVASVALGFRREDVAHALDGFGMLFPEHEQASILGTLFSSTLFPGRAPDGHVLLTSFVGGTRHPIEGRPSDDDLVARVMQDLGRILGVRGDPVWRHVSFWTAAIPQYRLDHGRVFDALAATEQRFPGLSFIGNYRGGISLGACMTSGLESGSR